MIRISPGNGNNVQKNRKINIFVLGEIYIIPTLFLFFNLKLYILKWILPYFSVGKLIMILKTFKSRLSSSDYRCEFEETVKSKSIFDDRLLKEVRNLYSFLGRGWKKNISHFSHKDLIGILETNIILNSQSLKSEAKSLNEISLILYWNRICCREYLVFRRS